MKQDDLGPPRFLLAHSQLTRSNARVSHLSSFNSATMVCTEYKDVTTTSPQMMGIEVNQSQMAFFQVDVAIEAE